MLPKTQRLNLKKDFKWVAAGKKIETKFIRLFVKQGENVFPKIGAAVSTKNFKKATDRNKAKRLTYTVFQSLYSLLPANINIVALPKAGIVDVKSAEVLEDLEKNLKNEKLINQSN